MKLPEFIKNTMSKKYSANFYCNWSKWSRRFKLHS